MESCQHCGHHVVNRPRGLCFRCYCTPGVREEYRKEIVPKYFRRGLGIGNHQRPLPSQPVSAQPGSLEKVAAMAERAQADVELFHPEDAAGD